MPDPFTTIMCGFFFPTYSGEAGNPAGGAEGPPGGGLQPQRALRRPEVICGLSSESAGNLPAAAGPPDFGGAAEPLRSQRFNCAIQFNVGSVLSVPLTRSKFLVISCFIALVCFIRAKVIPVARGIVRLAATLLRAKSGNVYMHPTFLLSLLLNVQCATWLRSLLLNVQPATWLRSLLLNVQSATWLRSLLLNVQSATWLRSLLLNTVV